MKVELFYDQDYSRESVSKMQTDVNRFINDKNVIDIKFTSEGAENGHSYMIMVIYK